MSEGIENIGKKDVAWGYAATFFSIGAGLILLPFILHKMSAETVGIWNIFQAITVLVFMLDFGFRPSFARNLSYIFSGVRNLQKTGVEGVSLQDGESAQVDYSLLKGTIRAMRVFYSWVALGVLVLLLTVGTAYFYYILQKYTGDRQDALVAWVILVIVNCYNIYTLYYDSLLTGKGYVKRSQQIIIAGQATYLIVAIGLIYAGLGLTAIVSAQLLSYIIKRTLSKRVFFTKQMKDMLKEAEEQDYKPILKVITPNSLRMGLTNLGGFVVNKSALFIGSAFLPLADIAAYGITMQVLDIMARCGGVMYQSYLPKLAQFRAERDYSSLGRYYRYSVAALFFVYVVGGLAFIFLGDWALSILRSDTQFLPAMMLTALLIIGLLEQNHVLAANFIMADNRIPFMWPSLISGAATILLLWLMLSYGQMGLWGLILAPGIAQLAYQNWKWPSVIIKELTAAKA